MYPYLPQLLNIQSMLKFLEHSKNKADKSKKKTGEMEKVLNILGSCSESSKKRQAFYEIHKVALLLS